MKLIIEYIVNMELSFFDKEHAITGRLNDQDHYKTFYIMRSSQLSAWTGKMLQSYLQDLQDAKKENRNLLAEKYDYMIKKSKAGAFKATSTSLPVTPSEKQTLLDSICQFHVNWLTELSSKYPRLIGHGRPIYRSEEIGWSTSFEIYILGELSTYSIRTLQLYKAYVESLHAKNENLNAMILENEVQQYGFPSLEKAESNLILKT